MAGRPSSVPTAPAPLRAEVLRELQTLLEDRDARDRLDRGPLAETKGRDHWLLHLLLRAHELGQAHTSNLVGTSYANLLARLQSIEESFARLETAHQQLGQAVGSRLEQVEKTFDTRLAAMVAEGRESVARAVVGTVDEKWKPVAESIETFARASHQLTKDISDTYRVATQTRLLLNENARRMIDLGRDLVALEEGLKLALGKVIEERFQSLEEKLGTDPKPAAAPHEAGTAAASTGSARSATP